MNNTKELTEAQKRALIEAFEEELDKKKVTSHIVGNTMTTDPNFNLREMLESAMNKMASSAAPKEEEKKKQLTEDPYAGGKSRKARKGKGRMNKSKRTIRNNKK